MTTRAGETGDRQVVLSVRDLTVGFGSNIVLDNLNLDIFRGEILGFVGASGTGKSVLMRTILRLLPRRSGTIEILGTDYDAADEEQRVRSEEHTSELQSLMRSSYAVFCLKKKIKQRQA